MPHPKNRLKLTGDTHLPDVGFEPIADDETVEMVMFVADTTDVPTTAPRVYADGWTPPAAREQPATPRATRRVKAAVRRAEQLPGRAPWLAIGGGLVVGWLVARMLRR